MRPRHLIMLVRCFRLVWHILFLFLFEILTLAKVICLMHVHFLLVLLRLLRLSSIQILYGKKELLSKIVPTKFGGGMNESYDDTNIELVSLPYRLEAGTPNISGIIAFSETIKFLNEIFLIFCKFFYFV